MTFDDSKQMSTSEYSEYESDNPLTDPVRPYLERLFPVDLIKTLVKRLHGVSLHSLHSVNERDYPAADQRGRLRTDLPFRPGRDISLEDEVNGGTNVDPMITFSRGAYLVGAKCAPKDNTGTNSILLHDPSDNSILPLGATSGEDLYYPDKQGTNNCVQAYPFIIPPGWKLEFFTSAADTSIDYSYAAFELPPD